MAKQLLNNKPSNKKPISDVKSVELYLDTLLIQKEAEARQIDEHFADIVSQVRVLVNRGGKRVRPQLVLNTYEEFGGTNSEGIIKVAASQELFHAFALIHDDIIDRDVIRWGGPNISGHYLKEFSSKLSTGEARHHADAWALLAGDLCLNLAFETLTESGFASKLVLKANRMVQQTLFAMIGGEVMDVGTAIYNPSDKELDHDHFMRLYNSKTAMYSFCTPLRLGALFAGAGGQADKHLNTYGYHLGIAFQIRDDILGIFGDESKMGKSTLSDIREGRRTMLMSYALNLANPRQKQVLERVLGNAKATYVDLKAVQAILKSTGALDKTQAVMRQHCDEARNILLQAGLPMTLNAYLADLLAFSVKRSR